jgi:hypothetical protein
LRGHRDGRIAMSASLASSAIYPHRSASCGLDVPRMRVFPKKWLGPAHEKISHQNYFAERLGGRRPSAKISIFSAYVRVFRRSGFFCGAEIVSEQWSIHFCDTNEKQWRRRRTAASRLALAVLVHWRCGHQ